VQPREQELFVADAACQHVFFDLGADFGTELEAPVFPILRVLLDQETLTLWVEPRDELHCHPPDGKMRVAKSMSIGRNSISWPHRSPLPMSISTSSRAAALGRLS
jgi:hypothetical protein